MDKPHLLGGWHTWDGAVVTYCTCGRAFSGATRDGAERIWQRHADQANGTGDVVETHHTHHRRDHVSPP